MLTLIKGKVRKSAYMELLHKGTNNSLFVQYGHEFPLLLPEGKECWSIERTELSKNDILRLKEELWELMEHIMATTEYRYIFLYGNFGQHEIGTLADVDMKLDGRLTLIASVDDQLVPDGQIIIEELQ